MKTYQAPWSTSLVVVSVLTTALLGPVGVLTGWIGHPVASVLCAVILLGSAAFTIRGYAVTREAILVRRLFWSTRLPLAGLQSAEADPEAMRASIRLFGNGGLFSFTGLFRNRALGNYRAYVTDPRRAVILRFAQRTVVLSPADPQEFVRDLSPAAKVA